MTVRTVIRTHPPGLHNVVSIYGVGTYSDNAIAILQHLTQYAIQASAPAGYIFSYWAVDGLAIDSQSANPAQITTLDFVHNAVLEANFTNVMICTPGEIEILEYCEDGTTWKHRRRCAPEGMSWIDETQLCPVCTSGDVIITEYCSDGATWKTRIRCVAGQWVTETNVCPVCIQGEVQILEYCSDGVTWKRRRRCVAGQWVEDTQPCPLCNNGDIQVLEMCPDGITMKRWRVCINGQWQEASQTCPSPPVSTTQAVGPIIIGL